jgi:histidinol-phosphate/aromatic aminotransferase/cobyric acid decarboxylase-like protein
MESPHSTLTRSIGNQALVHPSTALPFADFENTVTCLLQMAGDHTDRLIVAGHATPDLEIMAQRAELTVQEIIGVSPFTADPVAVLKAANRSDGCIYLSNPNRITGACFSPAELERLAGAVADGLLIIDEYYFDYFGISAARLLKRLANIVVLRPATTPSHNASTGAGYLITSPALIARCLQQGIPGQVNGATERLIQGGLIGGSALNRRLHELHEETLRLAAALTLLGAQCRITPTDYLLVRVADPKEVGNHLAWHKLTVENLDGYPGLKQYIRIPVHWPAYNDQLIAAFSRFPREIVAVRTPDLRSTRLQRPPETLGSATRTATTSPDRLDRIAVFRADAPARIKGKAR